MSEQIWYTADSHFGHESIIRLCNRPFDSVEHMTEEMIGRWNEVVAHNDIVYHLGDLFSFKKREMDLDRACAIRDRLNGHIWLLRGNHDDQSWLHDPRLRLDGYILPPYVDAIVDYSRRPDGNYKRVELIMCHYPIESWKNKTHGTPHLHGHTHGNSQLMKNRFDVGVDVFDFRPVSLAQIVASQAELVWPADEDSRW